MSDRMPRGVPYMIMFIFMSIILFLYSELHGLSLINKVKRLFWIFLMILFFVVQGIELNYLAR
jgi:hypothetical protein